MANPRDPVADLRRIAFLLEQAREPTYRVKAFRTAASVVRRACRRTSWPSGPRQARCPRSAGIGTVTERCVTESLAGEEPVYLRRLEATEAHPAGRGDRGAAGGAAR